MAYITVTSGTEYISFDLGDYSIPLNMIEVLRLKKSVTRVVRRTNWVEYWVADNLEPWLLHFETNSYNALIVDYIDGNEITSLTSLFNEIKNILTT